MRNKQFLLLVGMMILGIIGYSQTIPVGSCGLQYTYDASGNLTSRQYVCVNARIKSYKKADAVEYAKKSSTEMQKVDVVYTQSKSGLVSIQFISPLKNNAVRIVDAAGKEVQTLMLTGDKLKINLAQVPKGSYYMRLKSGAVNINQEIVKL
ncbi:T9SS type A sorting domain-containing protein [Niabella pedocola]|uniref:T9SS type A sorting domain-containing protein n=1 Tax=Niabella pedocola TaxID=1752077 RepID=A0ABS8PTQ6_9BACT|nr:T9SS type A sorting domain-containing protein [Niabella pedocola]MCD2424453.1 T9SS type A sorting domain-containing protein [Niabella pedocola]